MDWIKCSDRLPEDYEQVLTYCPQYQNRGEVCEVRWAENGKWGNIYHEITHWMPLPEPPKEE